MGRRRVAVELELEGPAQESIGATAHAALEMTILKEGHDVVTKGEALELSRVAFFPEALESKNPLSSLPFLAAG